MADQLNFIVDGSVGPWAVYTLSDGTKLRVRAVLTEVWRDGVGRDGKPKYRYTFRQFVEVGAPNKQNKSAIEREVSYPEGLEC